ncbi:LysM peptidoglycan-binding domain-containing protein [uncultured Tenacibaculum sp.]|uniref:CIS tube protein n=1 Tax=uncultured Tenacibaculum sp. TaxID=174713 RepID=UPI00261528AE|nr:LysM peptidoglycan-binding domain-containing protein [uncultured Tenacibaculum sp.]
MSQGELKKLVIKAYTDEKFNDEVADGEFTTLVNPEKYMVAYKPEYSEQQGQGTSATQPKFTRIAPQELDLDLLFDSSGVIDGEPNYKDGIIDKIEAFKRIVFDYSGEEHKPYYLMIKWGALLFKGSLVDLAIEYRLFAPDGTPLRANAKLKVKGTIDDDLRVARENNQSPDLTHYRKVKAGDTLPLMCHRIYGDSKYYLEVARVNKIAQFRKLQPGQELFFPPLQKFA